MMFRKMWFICVLLISATAVFQSQNVRQVDIQFQQKIEARDGTLLNIDIYRPVHMKEALPVLFAFTPYTTDSMFQNALYFAENGYVVVIGDVRGRGNSGGEFAPFERDGKDGHDICDWITEQPWCNGKIGMFGGSYVGMVQWLILMEMPESLKTIVPTAAVGPGIDFPALNNIFYTFASQWLSFTLGKTLNMNTLAGLRYWNDIYARQFVDHTAYSKLDEVSGIGRNRNFQKWIGHPTFDGYYKNLLPSAEEYAKFNLPILTITGHFDDDQLGTLNYYKNYMKYGKAEAREKCYILIGPWNHAGTRNPQKHYHNMSFDDNSVLNMNQLHLEWFNWTLKNGPKPGFIRDNAISYEMGSNDWNYGESLADLTGSVRLYYLHSEKGMAGDVFHSGVLDTKKPADEPSDSYEYNPLDTSGALDKIQDELIDYSWRQEKEAFSPYKLTYHTNPFKESVVLTGQVELKANISMDVPDTDFEAILYEIRPDGKCIYLTSAVMRARFRISPGKENLAKPGEINLYHFKSFHFTSRKIMKGSCLRLVFGALNSPYFQKNYNSGGDVTLETAKEARTAHIKLWHNFDYPSSLVLPIAK
jgi:putative CocE/NonD family hydrolase